MMSDMSLAELQHQFIPEASTSETIWDDPILFDEIDVPEISADCLPSIFGQFAKALAQETETSETLSTFTVLGVISSICAGKLFVSPRAGWQEPINIYTLIALAPANLKSIVLRRCVDPIEIWEREQSEILQTEIKHKRSERKTAEKLIERERQQCTRLKGQEQVLKIAEIAEMESNLPEIPVEPKLYATDATPESLSEATAEQGGSFAIFSDEGGILETISGLYSKNGSANVDIILKGFDGGTIRIRRKDRSVDLNPYLTMVMTVQPAIIEKMGRKQSLQGNGALERFMFLLPKSKLGYRTHEQPVMPSEVRDEYHRLINYLLKMFHRRETRLVLSLATEAYSAWRKFQALIETKLRPGGELSICQGFGGKLCGMTLRLAGLLHIARVDGGDITLETMKSAIGIAEKLIPHALAAYDLLGTDQNIELAKFVYHWIVRQQQSHFTRSELTYAVRHKKLNRSQKDTLIEGLKERNIIGSLTEVMVGDKPKKVFLVNPAVVASKQLHALS